jgi:hypothetical protein
MNKDFRVLISMMTNENGETSAVAISQGRLIARSDWHVSAEEAYGVMAAKLGAWISDRL